MDKSAVMTIIVVAANVAQAKEYWKILKDRYQKDKKQHVRYISNKESAWDGIPWRNSLIIFCGNYWKNKFYSSDLCNMYRRVGIQIVYERQ
ncbi:hypothetical protein H9I32_11920 [Bacillus sp. Xin]|uniref:hypothetical protein n=1 Tax=unclassified Bacillus (in: firmicutes) TaxID=185979 RepID=UPI0015743127|nr:MULTISPECIES: hypothetical protein [unclassified Bacillus (in: firmicutes)]MBC6973058.1 hypothetical protein [Bacillus sp. Xin]NSW37705.1 hypothetical protein [Bacillus sp. Xin1]